MPQIQTDVRDAEARRAACRQLGLAEPVLGAFPLGSAVASGFAVRLPGWRYPVVCQLVLDWYSSTIPTEGGRARHNTSIVKSAGLIPYRRIQCPTL